MALTNTETLELEEAGPRRLGQGWRIGITVLGVILAGMACGIIAVAFVQGSWWYSYGTDQALDHESQARVEAIRDEVDASGTATEAVVWLDAALDPNSDPSAVRYHLLTAWEILKAADDPKLTQAAGELQGIIQQIQSSHPRTTGTPRPVSTPEWP
jgi:hypothetical protein